MPGLKKLDITFSMEAQEGDVLQIHAAEIDGLCYFTGYHERGKCFDAIAEPAPIIR